MANEQSNTIYHYTDWKAFEDIVVNKKIRLSNVSFSNDSKELIEYLYNSQYNKLYELFLKNYKKDSRVKFLIGRDYAYESVNFNPLFAFCFTKNRDDAAQWERYACNGAGVCIGFNEEYIKLIFESPFKYQSIKYDLNEYGKIKIETFDKNIKQLEDKNKDNPDNFNKTNKKVLKSLYNSSIFYKNKSFQTENEYRLGITSVELQNIKRNKNFSDEKKKIYSSEINYFVTNNKIREYVEFELDSLCNINNKVYSDLINEIIISPKSIMNEELVKRYLESKGLKELAKKVKKSKSSLR